MKFFFNCILLCLIISHFVACKKEAANPSGSLPVTAGTIAGNFTVSSFINNGEQISTFSNYTFTFKENGTIAATNGSSVYTGTWRFDDSNTSEIKINFLQAPLDELNGSWHIKSLTDDHLYLGGDSDDDDAYDDHPSRNDSLEFERD